MRRAGSQQRPECSTVHLQQARASGGGEPKRTWTAVLLLVASCAPDLSALTSGRGVDGGQVTPAVGEDARATALSEGGDGVDVRSPDSGTANPPPGEASAEAALDEMDDAADDRSPDQAEASAGDDAEAGSTSACPGWSVAFSGGYAAIRNPVADDFTIEAWIKPSAPSKTGTAWWEGNALFWADVSGSANDFAITLVNDRVAFAVGGGSAGIDSTVWSERSAPLGSWTHVAATRHHVTGTLVLYLNGRLEATLPQSNLAPLTASSQLVFGSIDANSRSAFLGSMAEVRFWNVVRTGDEIQNAMHTTLTGTEPGLVAYYRLDEGTGAVAKDRANGNDAAMGSPFAWESGSGDCGVAANN